jgi:hypothetical protein
VTQGFKTPIVRLANLNVGIGAWKLLLEEKPPKQD